MLLTILTLSCFALGSSINDHDYTEYDHKRCYGRDFRFPFEYTPPGFRGQIYFTPSKTGGSRKLVMENGEAKDPRLKVSLNSVTLEHLTERDEGTFSISVDGNRLHDVIELEITECAEQVVRSYNGRYSHNVPRGAEFLEFTPIFRLDQPRVLWNRTDPQTNTGGRGHVKRNVWEISELTQTDNGFYNFRKKDKTLKSRIKLIVQEHKTYYDAKVNEELRITYPVAFTPWHMAFTPKGEKKSIMLMRAGNLVEEDDSMSESFTLRWRIYKMKTALFIDPVESTDSGAFEFRDQEGNLALVVQVKVEDDFPPAYVYALIAFGIILVIGCCCCCCCLRKRTYKTSSAKRESTPQTAAAPAAYYHGRNQPEGPSYSAAPPPPAYSHQPYNPLGTQEPTREPTTSLGPPAYNPVDIHVNPTQPEVAVPGGQGAAPTFSLGSDCLSSDSGPTFELKGVNFPSAPPLSSNSDYNDVYTSDQLNFL
ncbi:uncharacterized protein LOC121901943 isoform X1 [Thunnus maccoyii]|uniref:uncharacterized protein LOC121901943 isoform X1 n=1 Tax=Thunnus maccoyii TaxID=8240 RepID=UPI001C4B3C0D|nr:uncharacterized protein LOC121901943 isoform X1 [Thunnus maccoyii]